VSSETVSSKCEIIAQRVPGSWAGDSNGWRPYDLRQCRGTTTSHKVLESTGKWRFWMVDEFTAG